METVKSALHKFQEQGISVAMDSHNPYHDSTYASLQSAIHTIVKHGTPLNLCFTQLIDFEIVNEQQYKFVRTIVYHAVSGDSIESRTPIILDPKKQHNPQAMGASITYAKRYGLLAIFGLPTEDDDGNSAIESKDHFNKADKKTAPGDQTSGEREDNLVLAEKRLIKYKKLADDLIKQLPKVNLKIIQSWPNQYDLAGMKEHATDIYKDFHEKIKERIKEIRDV